MANGNFGLGVGQDGVGQSNTDYFGNTGTESVTFNSAIPGLNTNVDQNIEQVNFAGASSTYNFQQAGNTLKVFSGSTLVTTIIIQDDSNGTLVSFGGGDVFQAKLTGTVMTIGTETVLTTAGPIDLGDDGSSNPGDTFDLDFTRDRLTGTAGDDVFVADIVQNNNGEQVNSLGTGDTLNGLGGDDRLSAVVQAASSLNDSPAAPIRPTTVDVEVALFDAQPATAFSESAFVEIRADRMWGLNEIGSAGITENTGSDATVVITDVNTLTDSGEYNDRRVTESITVRMDHTGNATGGFPEADLIVLFDQDYLLASPPGESNSQLRLQLLDIDNEIVSGQPLLTNPFDTLVFGLTVGSAPREEFELEFDGNSAQTGMAAYQELAASINAALQAEGLTDLVASVGPGFSAVDPDGDPVPGGVADGFNIYITNMGPGSLDAVGFIASGVIPPNTDYQKQVELTPPATTPEFITVDIALDKVGRGADGGELVVGGMGQDNGNVLNGRDDPLGIEQFDITVSGDDTQDSSLSNLSSTSNALRFVYIESDDVTDEDDAADLIIGNSNSFNVSASNPFELAGADQSNLFDVTTVRNNALKDVLIFDTTGSHLATEGVGEFFGDVTVNAFFSRELREKYLDQTDTQPDPQGDDMDAVYTTGSGDDTINLAFNEINFTSQGTVTRDDFSMTVVTNDGNDHVLFQIGDGDGLGEDGGEDSLPQVDNWYHNHVLSDNFNVVTGAGDDFVESWGSSAARISLGSGNDLVYTDNSGEVQGFKPDFDQTDDIAVGYHATWAFNSQNDELSSLESELPVTYQKVGNVRLTVTYQGIERTVEFANTNGAAGGNVSDLDINQKIKEAINTEGSPFAGLLVAEDGPARTLIVRSLTDGERYEDDLNINIFSLAIRADQVGVTQIQSSPNFSELTDRYLDSDFADFFGSQMDGADSTVINNDRVNGGTGDDTIVLSTNGDSVEHVVIDGVFSSASGESVDGVTTAGVKNVDIILNFEAAVETALSAETQTFDFEDVDGGEDGAVGDGTITLTVLGVEVEIPFADGDTALELATAAVAAINDDASGVPGTAVLSGDDVIVTADVEGAEFDDPQVEVVGGGIPEEQTVTFEGALSVGQVVTVSFGSLGTATHTVVAGDTLITLVNALAADFQNNTGVDDALVTVDATDPTSVVLDLTNSAIGNVNDALVTIQTTGTNNLDVAVATEVQGDDAGFTIATSFVPASFAELTGWDIFDLSSVLGATSLVTDLNVNFGDDVTDTANFGNGVVEYFSNNIVDGAEEDEMDLMQLDDRSVIIINQYLASDSSVSSAAAESQRIEDYLNSIDTAGANTASKSVIITVDENDDNLGRFYLVDNGNNAKDVNVTFLGAVEFGDHFDPATAPQASLENIGEWGLLTEINFEPLTNAQLAATTFTV
jgi:hypothetical protein